MTGSPGFRGYACAGSGKSEEEQGKLQWQHNVRALTGVVLEIEKQQHGSPLGMMPRAGASRMPPTRGRLEKSFLYIFQLLVL